MTSDPQTTADEVTQRLMHLRGMLADLDSYIQRRAEELTEPLIESAGERAREMVAEAEHEAQRWKDVNTELGRRLEVRDRLLREMDGYRDRLAAALAVRPPTSWPSLVADIELHVKENTDD